MYESIKDELVDLLYDLQPGDGIWVEHNDFYPDEDKGYLATKKKHHLVLRPKRKTNNPIMNIINYFQGIEIYYGCISHIIVFDPIKK